MIASGPAAADDPVAAAIPVRRHDRGSAGRRADGGSGTAAVEQAFALPLELQLGSTRVLVAPDVLEATPVVDKAIERALAAQPGSAIALGVTVVPGGIASFVFDAREALRPRAVDSKLYLRNLRPWLSKEANGRRLDAAAGRA